MTGGANCAAWGRFRRRRLRPVRRSAALCGAVCVLACAWECAAALRGRGGAEREVLLQTEGIRVVRGAPVGDTVTRVAWETLCGGRLLWLDERHPLPAGFPGPDTRGVRKTVGAYLNAAEEVCLDRETVQALCDTGFSVQDPLSGRAVVLLHYPSVRDGLPQALRAFLDSYFACGAAPPPELGVRLVPCTTIAGHCVLPAVPAKVLRVGSRRVQGFLAAFCRPETPPEHWTALLDSELAGQLGIR